MIHSELHRIKLLAILLFMVFGPLAMSAQVAMAQGTPAVNPDVEISIRPKDGADGDRFRAQVNAGETVVLTAIIQNHGSESIKLRTYASDVIPANNGGLVIADREAEKHGQTLWMDYATEEFTLEPGQSIERPLSISVPADTEPGQYVNAVALETVDPVDPQPGAAFEQYFRKVVSVYIEVPGDFVTAFELGEPEVLVGNGQTGIQIPITNTGDVRIDVYGEIYLTDTDGNVILGGDVRLGPIYNGQATFIQVAFGSIPEAGEYHLSYSLTDFNTDTNVSSEEIAVDVPEAESTEVAPIAFENMVIEGNADPIVFANVSLDVTIAQSSYRSTRLTLSVFHEGEHVEDFVLADNLSLSQGTTNVTQRYLPATGFVSGEYTFSLKLESTEGGQTTILYEEENVATLEVP